MAETKTVNLEVNSNLAKTEQAVTSLRSELRKAQAEVANLSDKFGATSKEAIEAAKRAAELKDRIGDAKDLTDSFNPDSKFKALAGAANIAAGALSGFEGAMALVGVQSEEAQQAILKVQGALALSQGIEQLQTIPDTFRNIKAVAVDALKGIKTGIAATGIGLLIIALGTVYAYWDDIKEAVSGVTKEQKNQQEALSKNIELQKQKLDSLNSQDNVLKLQGKSEKEILNSKAKQYEATIKLVELQLESDAKIQEQREKNEERNANILKNIITGSLTLSSMGLRLLAAPIDLLIATANKVSKTLGFGEIIGTNLNEKITEINKQVSEFSTSFIFNPEKVKQEGIKTATETKNYLDKLKNDKAGFLLQINSIDKQAGDDAAKISEDNAKALEESRKRSREDDEAIRNEIQQAISDTLDKQSEFLVSAQEAEEQKVKDKYFRLIEYAKQFGIDTKELEIAQDNELNEIRLAAQQKSLENEKANSYAKIKIAEEEAAAKQKALQAMSSGLKTAASLLGESTAAGKAAAIAATTIDTIQSGVSAFKGMVSAVPGPVGIALGAVAAAGALASGYASVKKILAVKTPNGGGGGAAPSGGGVSAPSFNVVGNSGVNQLAETMAGKSEQAPIKAYVVSNDVTSAQGLDRKIITNASLG